MGLADAFDHLIGNTPFVFDHFDIVVPNSYDFPMKSKHWIIDDNRKNTISKADYHWHNFQQNANLLNSAIWKNRDPYRCRQGEIGTLYSNLNQLRNPGTLGQVRDIRLCLWQFQGVMAYWNTGVMVYRLWTLCIRESRWPLDKVTEDRCWDFVFPILHYSNTP